MIQSIMSKNLVTVTEEDTINDTVSLMDKYHYKELPVVDSKNWVLGLVTYSNLLGIIKFKGESKVKGYVEGVPIVHEDDSEEYVLNLMINSGLTGLPVVDEHDHLKGFISDYDMINFYKDNLKGMPLTDVNVKKVPAVKENATLAEVRNILNFNKRDRLPVVDNKGEFVGTVLFIDILRRMNKSDAAHNTKRDIISERKNIMSSQIKDLVRKGVKVTYDSDLYTTADIMLKNQLLGLIIVNSKNEPIGGIDRCSILKLLSDINVNKEINIEIVGQVNENAIEQIRKIIKSQLKLLPSFESSIKNIKIFIKRVHDDKSEGKVDVRLTIQRDGQNDILIQKTDYDILLTLMDCVDKANAVLKNKVKK